MKLGEPHKGQAVLRTRYLQKVRVMRRAKDDGYTLDQLQRLGKFKNRQGLMTFLRKNGL